MNSGMDIEVSNLNDIDVDHRNKLAFNRSKQFTTIRECENSEEDCS